jgi:hypothetical protein
MGSQAGTSIVCPREQIVQGQYAKASSGGGQHGAAIEKLVHLRLVQ